MSWSKVSRKMSMLNTLQYMEMRHEAFKNDGTTPDVILIMILMVLGIQHNIQTGKNN